jgi:hypothetical protein
MTVDVPEYFSITPFFGKSAKSAFFRLEKSFNSSPTLWTSSGYLHFFLPPLIG